MLTPALDGYRVPRNIYVRTSSPMSIILVVGVESIWASPNGCPVGRRHGFMTSAVSPGTYLRPPHRYDSLVGYDFFLHVDVIALYFVCLPTLVPARNKSIALN